MVLSLGFKLCCSATWYAWSWCGEGVVDMTWNISRLVWLQSGHLFFMYYTMNCVCFALTLHWCCLLMDWSYDWFGVLCCWCIMFVVVFSNLWWYVYCCRICGRLVHDVVGAKSIFMQCVFVAWMARDAMLYFVWSLDDVVCLLVCYIIHGCKARQSPNASHDKV